MGIIDWLIVVAYAGVLAVFVVRGRTKGHNPTAYLVAGRHAGKYLLASSSGMMWLGLAVATAEVEKYYEAGFAAAWWALMFAPLGYVLSAFGWISYRFRQTEAMTIGQFFEMRYSRSFRVCAGLAMLIAGILNYGIFPSVSAEVLVAVAGLPPHFSAFGLDWPTVSVVVAILISLGLGIALLGGFVAILIADFVQSHLFYITILVVVALVCARLGWHEVTRTAFSTPMPMNPFAASGTKGFGTAFFVLLALRSIYNYDNWPSGQSFMAAARSPHEARMAGILGEWRGNLQMFALMSLALAAFLLLHHPSSAGVAGIDHASAEAGSSRLVVPLTVATALPAGLLGLFCSVLLGASLARDNADLLTWGEVFIQDVIIPLRGRPFAPQRHLLWLRISVTGVGALVLLWSWLFPLRQYVWLYLNLSGSVYLGGSGIVLIGGLYWKGARTAGAWAAMIAGAAVTLLALVLQLAWPHNTWLRTFGPMFPLDGMWVAFWASAAAIVAYFAGSWFASAPDRSGPWFPRSSSPARSSLPGNRLAAFWHSLSCADRVIYSGQLLWSFGLAAQCLGITAWHYFVRPPGPAFWGLWWKMVMAGMAIVSVVTLVWLLIGGTADVLFLLKSLRADEQVKPTPPGKNR